MTKAVAVQVASSSTTDFLNFLKRKHHHSFHKDVDFFCFIGFVRCFIGGSAEASGSYLRAHIYAALGA